MPEPSTIKEEIKPPPLGTLFELSMTALVNAPGAFTRLAARPAPGPGVSCLVALAWGAVFFTLNLTHVALSNPGMLQAYEPWKIGAVGALALGAWAALYLLASCLIFGLGRVLGSEGDFERALLVAAVTLTAAPVQALCTWFPAAWIVPAVLAAWIAACGLSALFKAGAWPARGVCAALAAVVLALQYGAGLALEKYAGTVKFAAAAARSAPSPDQILELQQQMLQVQALADAAPKASDAPRTGDSPQAEQSSLDLLRGPGPDEPPPAGATSKQQLAQINTSADTMNKSVINMLDSITPMLNNPMITQSMTAAQKSDYAELQKLIQGLKNGMATNSITSPQEQQAKMMKIQQLVMRLMSAGISSSPANKAGAKK